MTAVIVVGGAGWYADVQIHEVMANHIISMLNNPATQNEIQTLANQELANATSSLNPGGNTTTTGVGAGAGAVGSAGVSGVTGSTSTGSSGGTGGTGGRRGR